LAPRTRGREEIVDVESEISSAAWMVVRAVKNSFNGGCETLEEGSSECGVPAAKAGLFGVGGWPD
jgi:hypothetical protein